MLTFSIRISRYVVGSVSCTVLCQRAWPFILVINELFSHYWNNCEFVKKRSNWFLSPPPFILVTYALHNHTSRTVSTVSCATREITVKLLLLWWSTSSSMRKKVLVIILNDNCIIYLSFGTIKKLPNVPTVYMLQISSFVLLICWNFPTMNMSI